MDIDKIIKLVQSDYKIYTSSESKKIIEKYCYALDIDNGNKEIYIFIGPSGSGKSTFIANLYSSGILNLPFINRFVYSDKIGSTTTLDEEIFTKVNLAKYGRSFVLETASTDFGNISFYKKLKRKGYKLNIFIMTAKDIDINISNIKKRESEGGHSTDNSKVTKELGRLYKYFTKVIALGTNVVYVKNMTSDSNARIVVPLKLNGKEKSLDKADLLNFLSTPNITFDLHMHTTYSDGKYSVRELIKIVEDKGIDVVSITDHNTLQAYDEIKRLKIDRSKIILIPGVEINAVFNEHRVEILGYGFDIDKMRHFKHLNIKVRNEYREKQFNKLLELADKVGLKHTKKLSYIGHNTPASELYDDITKFEENKWFLDKYNVKGRAQFCREVCYNKDTELYVEDYGTPSVKEVCDYIHRCGGIAVIAHIYAYGFKDTNKILDDLIAQSCLDGIEVLYPSFTLDEMKYLKKLCKKHKLIATGGSDFHRESRLYANTMYDNNSIGYLPSTDTNISTDKLNK